MIMEATNLFTVPPHPPVFYAQKILYDPPHTTPFHIDGNVLDKPIWQAIPWSEPFSEIRGTDYDNRQNPNNVPPAESTPAYHHCQTRMKMLWDDEFLYVAALLEYSVPDIYHGQGAIENVVDEKEEQPRSNKLRSNEGDDRVSEIIATYTERNSPIYHQDSDFEVFIDPDSSCHNYKELEMNAINTVWNLMLDKPYNVGGSEHSARKGVSSNPSDANYYEVYDQTTAAKVVSGQINKKGTLNDYMAWTVEIKLAHSDTLQKCKSSSTLSSQSSPDVIPCYPKIGHFWRINFSHVEWEGKINWTWAPQLSWDTKQKLWRGFVEMHRPEAWGYVYFLGEPVDLDFKWTDTLWDIRSVAMMIFYELRQFKEDNGKYTQSLSDLGVQDILKPHFSSLDINIQLMNNDAFLLTVMDKKAGSVSVTNDQKVVSSAIFTDAKSSIE